MGGNLPKNWIETNLETIIERMSNGSGLKQFEEPFENSFPISRIETIWNESIDLDRVKYVNPTKTDIEKYSFLKGDVLFSHINSDKHLGKTAVFNLDTILIHGINLLLLRAQPQFNGYLLNYFLRYYRLTGKFIEVAQRSVNQSSINQKKLNTFKIPLPPLAEQNRIVEKLDRLFAQLEILKTSMAKVPLLLKDFRQQVLTQAVTGKLLKINQFTELGKLEIDIRTGPFGSALHKSDYIENGVSVINPSHINNGIIIPDTNVSISNEKYQKLKVYKLINNDVILGRRGEMGRAALYNESYGNCICGTGSIILRCGSNLYPKFLTFYIRSPFCIEYLNSNSVGTTMINLNQKIIKSLKVPNVSYLEQQEIVSRVESLFAKADAIEQQYKSLKAKIDTLPQAILHKAFKGELTEQLDSDGDASELLKQIQELKMSAVKPKKSTTKKVKSYPEGDGVLGMVAEK